MLEFLVAELAILEVWSQVGGQNHLDLMPWYTKLSLALVMVAGTVSAVSHERAWNAKTIACFALGLMIAGAMGGVTLYYHLHESDETESSDAPTSISRLGRAPAASPHGRFLMILCGRSNPSSDHLWAHSDAGEAHA